MRAVYHEKKRKENAITRFSGTRTIPTEEEERERKPARSRDQQAKEGNHPPGLRKRKSPLSPCHEEKKRRMGPVESHSYNEEEEKEKGRKKKGGRVVSYTWKARLGHLYISSKERRRKRKGYGTATISFRRGKR